MSTHKDEVDLTVLDDDDQQQGSAATKLVKLALKDATLFTSPGNVEFASYQQNGNTETWSINSGEMRGWLSQKYYNNEGQVVSESALKDARRTLAGLATYEGSREDTHLRVAKYEDGYLIDLCNECWQVVYVRPGCFDVLDKSPVKFYRTSTMLPLPVPDDDKADVDKLFDFVNIDEDAQDLFLTALNDWIRPDTPHQIVEIVGEHGSGKSAQQRCVVAVTDPSTVPLSGKPKSVDDMFVAAVNQHIYSMDNLSYLSPETQDELCRLATGGGRKQRKLYTDADVHAMNIKRPVIMNGIEVVATRPDLIDRIVQVQVPPIVGYRSESDFWRSFTVAQPAIFSGLLQLFANTLKCVGQWKVPSDLRQQDYVELGQAVSYVRRGDPQSFVDQYRTMRTIALTNALESDPAISALINYVQGHDGGYSGPQGQLLGILMEQRNVRSGAKDWPTERGFKGRLKRALPALRLVGIQVQFDPDRHNDGFHVTIKKIRPEHSRRSQHSQISELREHREHWNGKNNMDTPENGCIEQGRGALDEGFVDELDIPQDWKDCDDSNGEVEIDV